MGTTQRVHSTGTAALTGGAALTAATLIAAILILAGSRAALADTAPPAGDPATVVPQENFLSSLKQAFKQDFDHAVVRGQFDVGTPPDAHRYYCLIDTKTGKRPPNGVSGQTSVRADGMTGIKVGAVTLYACDSAEQQGILVTSGYVLSASIPHVAEAPKPPTPAAPVPAAAPAAPAAAATPAVVSPAAVAPLASPAGKVDVAGVKLGMSPDEVRGVLKARRLLNYLESSATLGRGDDAYAGSSLRFVNVIAAWTGSSAPAESYEVMFTPVPGRERVMAIVHTQAFPGADAPSVAVLDAALARKYGGFAATSPFEQPSGFENSANLVRRHAELHAGHIHLARRRRPTRRPGGFRRAAI